MLDVFVETVKDSLFTGLNFVVWIKFIMPSSKSLSSSIGGGSFVDLKPKFSLVDVDWSGWRKKWAFQRILRRKSSVSSMRQRR